MAATKKETEAPSGAAATQPGTVIAPGSAAPVSAAQSPLEATIPEPTAGVSQPTAATADGNSITWTASEFIAHQKSIGWYLTLATAAIAVAAIIYIVTKDLISTIVVLVGAFVLGFYAARQPRQVEYRLDGGGVSIDGKYYPYDEFRSYAIVPEGAFSSIVFMPMKRFGQLTTIYYAPDDGDRIVDLLDNTLPAETHRLDMLDNLMRRIRF